jgi:hypothetical protein
LAEGFLTFESVETLIEQLNQMILFPVGLGHNKDGSPTHQVVLQHSGPVRPVNASDQRAVDSGQRLRHVTDF